MKVLVVSIHKYGTKTPGLGYTWAVRCRAVP